MKEFFAEVNGIKICYQIHGSEDGDPVILVHGFGSKKETWIAQISDLSEKYKVISFDNRGAGKSERPNETCTMDMFADDIIGLMDFLDIKKAKAIIGWSLGGMIVQHFLLKYQERVEKAALLLTNYKGVGGHLYAKHRHEGLELLKKDPEAYFWEGAIMSFHQKFRKQMEKDPKKKFYGLWSVEDQIRENTINPPPHNDIDNQAAALETHNTLDRLHEIKIPTLLIAGSHDRLCPKSTMEEMAQRLSNCTLKVMAKAGHGAPHSRAPEVNRIIMDFLKTSLERELESSIRV
ncbi:MAG: alpha/beta hydrolase [Promethearchaeota archaeon]|nr:MAG: alpha/beta hydrolase [Candidatus Lokiarchaeota archaeon]